MPDSSLAGAAPTGSRAARTRLAILDAAEQLFAERGFDATRLEDVAVQVGIKRASIVYHFRDKRELYGAVLESVFRDFLGELEIALSSSAPLAQRIESAVSAWVATVGRRPTLARLLLREVADAHPLRETALLDQTRPFFELVQREVFERSGKEAAQLATIDPIHLASTIAGATVFFVAAMPTLVPGLGFDPVSPDHLESHRQELLRIVRRLLGTRGPRSTS